VPLRDGLINNRVSLAIVLRERGDMDGGIALCKENIRAYDDARSKRELATLEQLRAILPRLPDVAAGNARPATPLEAIDFARLCAKPFQQRFAAAARIYGEVSAADPKLADDLTTELRYFAARAAARAAHGEGADAPADPAARAELRAAALNWLRAELAARRK